MILKLPRNTLMILSNGDIIIAKPIIEKLIKKGNKKCIH